MKLKTILAAAIAGAFALPLAAQASADSDRIILAQAGGPAGASSTGTGPTGGSGTTGAIAGPDSASNKTAPSSDTATSPSTSGQGKPQ